MLAVLLVVLMDDWWAIERVAMKDVSMADEKVGRMDESKVE